MARRTKRASSRRVSVSSRKPTRKSRTSSRTTGGNFWTTKQVARRFRVAESTVRSWLSCGKLSGRKVGSVWQVPAATVKTFKVSTSSSWKKPSSSRKSSTGRRVTKRTTSRSRGQRRSARKKA